MGKRNQIINEKKYPGSKRGSVFGDPRESLGLHVLQAQDTQSKLVQILALNQSRSITALKI